MIRRHFTDLTAKLLAPINRFQVAGNGESASKFGEEVVSGQSFPVDQFIRGLGGGDDTGVFRGTFQPVYLVLFEIHEMDVLTTIRPGRRIGWVG